MSKIESSAEEVLESVRKYHFSVYEDEVRENAESYIPGFADMEENEKTHAIIVLARNNIWNGMDMGGEAVELLLKILKATDPVSDDARKIFFRLLFGSWKKAEDIFACVDGLEDALYDWWYSTDGIYNGDAGRYWIALDPDHGITGYDSDDEELGVICPYDWNDMWLCIAELECGFDPITFDWEDGTGTPCCLWVGDDGKKVDTSATV